jgi:uncharacterized protein RhaS with RHS repeats
MRSDVQRSEASLGTVFACNAAGGRLCALVRGDIMRDALRCTWSAVVRPTHSWCDIRTVRGVLRELASRNASDGSLGTSSWTWTRDNVWRDSLLLASRQPGATASTISTYHYHLDHLGTPRQVTDDAKMIVGRHSYHPFGPAVPGGLNEPNPSNLNYTGHERDAEIELDYMHARFYDGRVGGSYPSIRISTSKKRCMNRRRGTDTRTSQITAEVH